MEGRKQMDSSSASSFASDLFGSRDSSGSSSGIFGSIFAPSSKVLGRESLRTESVEKKQDTVGHVSRTKTGAPGFFPFSDGIDRTKEGESQNSTQRDVNSFYNEEKVQPCHLSSSIYYGGQDIYSYPQNTQSAGYSTFNKDAGEDDSGSASRGNWWQGSHKRRQAVCSATNISWNSWNMDGR
ncbi:hypothetical protein RJ639_031961 [Escallonia herrerae]|uniref:Uncharacterized protein n=1 Tax=Escallonia herrerae TaxID=1293975 RepID=A0AA88X046_9ASTE|nr:hypothetical protein RJ639_031961 [Escallonia herrerae]